MANFGRVKTWGTEVLQPTDLNAEFDNIINNITSGGVDADNIDLTDVYAWTGAHSFSAATTHTNTVTVGVDDTGHDVKFFGATTGKSWLWDESADTEIVTGNSTISGTLGVTGVLTATAQSVHTGGIQVGGNIVSDTDSTDNLGTSSVRWANLFVDSIGDTGQDLTIAATTTNLPSGHVTDYAGADVVLTHSAGVLNVSTGALQVGGVAVATGTNAVTSYTNTTDNRVLTSGGTTVINGEENLTFNGSLLTVTGRITSSNAAAGTAVVDASNTNTTLDGGLKGLVFSGDKIRLGGGNTSANAGIASNGSSSGIEFITNDGSTWATRMTLSASGTLSKSGGSFNIEHPHPDKKNTHRLVHSFIEGPQADLIYRGTVQLVDGTATVNIDTAASMTEGTFILLNRDVQVFTSNESGWGSVRGSVSSNILTIEAEDTASTDSIAWLVVGERCDPWMMGSDMTDNTGNLITEPALQ